MTRKILLALVCGTVLVASVAGYMPAWGVIVSGTVTDTEGGVVAGALVTFREEAESGRAFGDTTDGDGRYRVVLAEVIVAVEEEAERRNFKNKPDLVIVTAALLEKKWKGASRSCVLVRNGVDCKFFAA